MIPSAVEFSIVIWLVPWDQFFSWSIVYNGMPILALLYNAPHSTYDATSMKFYSYVWDDDWSISVGCVTFLFVKYTFDMMRAFNFVRYEVLLKMLRIMLVVVNGDWHWGVSYNNQILGSPTSCFPVSSYYVIPLMWLVKPIAFCLLCIHIKVMYQSPSGLVLYHWELGAVICPWLVPSELVHRTGENQIFWCIFGPFGANVLVFM